MVDYTPEQGDIVWLTLNPQKGHEQSGRRPAVVLSPSAYNSKVSLAIFCPITSKEKSYPFEVRLPEKCSVRGVLLVDQVKSFDWRSRNAEYICTISSSLLKDISKKLKLLLP
ncbi:endoribonuclease MazF [bacterium]|nr:endoribonuclease MazF [bacterium]